MTSTTESGTAILKTDTRGRVWTPKADREALLDLFEQGEMSGAAFAGLHGLLYPGCRGRSSILDVAKYGP